MMNTELLVLAGGFGTRLRAAVADVPKPLAPVGGKPYLQYMIEAWRTQGVRSYTFLLHHQADIVNAFLRTLEATGEFAGCTFRSVTEPQPLGTGGAIAYAIRELNLQDAFLVANADTWLGHGVQELEQAVAPAMAVLKVPDASRYGTVAIEQDKVLAFKEKQISTPPGWINAGFYKLSPELFRQWDGNPFSIEQDVFPALAANGKLRAVCLNTEFIDIGIPEDYFRFCRWIESGKSEAL